MLQSGPRPSPDPAHAQEELRQGIKHSRVLVRQSSFLIALSESEGATPDEDDEHELRQ